MPDKKINKKIKVLVIDDEPEICALIKYFLTQSGNYKVLIAKGGSIGAFLASLSWHKPDLIILDIMMPGIDGFEALRRIKEDKKTMYIPVIMLTARNDPASKVKAEGLYCDDYIVKPVELAVLKSRIEEVLRRHGRKV